MYERNKKLLSHFYLQFSLVPAGTIHRWTPRKQVSGSFGVLRGSAVRVREIPATSVGELGASLVKEIGLSWLQCRYQARRQRQRQRTPFAANSEPDHCHCTYSTEIVLMYVEYERLDQDIVSMAEGFSHSSKYSPKTRHLLLYFITLGLPHTHGRLLALPPNLPYRQLHHAMASY